MDNFSNGKINFKKSHLLYVDTSLLKFISYYFAYDDQQINQ